MSKFTIEVQGIGFPNKGAELMLCSIAERVQQRYGDKVRLTCVPNRSSDESVRLMRKIGVFPLCDFRIRRIPVGWIFDQIPNRLLSSVGLVRPRDIDFVLDASGFRFSDDFGSREAVSGGMRRLRSRWRRRIPFVMLPQGFGPFSNSRCIEEMRSILDQAKLIYARDEVSYQYLSQLGSRSNIRLYPDLTIGYKGLQGGYLRDFEDCIVIIPNERMQSKGEPSVRSAYFDFLVKLSRHLLGFGWNLVCLNHEGHRDERICVELSRRVSEMKMVSLCDPREIKAAIGSARLVVSSRFHGFVSALSQGVPAFCTSWSHKYEQIAKDFEVKDAVLEVDADRAFQKIKLFVTDDQWFTNERNRLLEISRRHEEVVDRMWTEVFSLIEESLGI